MSKLGPVKGVKVEDLHMLPELTPAPDKVFDYLLEQAIKGHLEVYYAAVPLKLVTPFDKEYDPRKHPVGQQAIDAFFQAWQKNDFQISWVYPKSEKFILSDDYIVYYAVLKGQPDYIPCYVLGGSKHPDLKDIQGPISTDDIRRLLGFGDSKPNAS